ncbi:MAG: YggT family protein, partial [Pseudomonadota bacterium]|nr:YggT family protein [Pseudomonadota bacterium]
RGRPQRTERGGFASRQRGACDTPCRGRPRRFEGPTMLSLLQLIDTVINLYIWALLIFIVLSWLVQFKVINSNNRAVYLVMDFLYRITEPVLRPIRNLLPNLGGLDISPIVLVLALTFGRNLLFEFFAGRP